MRFSSRVSSRVSPRASSGVSARLVSVLALLVLGPMGCFGDRSGSSVPQVASYVGSGACEKCHEQAVARFAGSDHDLAMQPANEHTVLGNFDDATFEQGDVRTRFFRRGSEFWVETAGPAGDIDSFRVAYTFGYDPLQQYLIEFPAGRYQCLTVVWDVKEKRWYSLYPDSPPRPGEWLHWTGTAANWNGMCAECHSTRLEKNYDLDTRSYATTWTEIDVSCEACHGPASLHVDWARRIYTTGRRPSGLGDDAAQGLLVSAPASRSQNGQLTMCGPCHARRALLTDLVPGEGADPLDVFVPALLEEGLYFADGQIQDEVYVYSSFLQSLMYRRGVRCSDCHDPHSTKLRAEGNALCLRCHDPLKFDQPSHHHHKMELDGRQSDASLCVRCHMPERTYMGIDLRADHSLRVPRPDLSIELGTPNACAQTDCHSDRTPEWLDAEFRKRHPAALQPHYGSAFAAARANQADAGAELVELALQDSVSDIVHATALSLLEHFPETDGAARVIERGLSHTGPLVRLAAASEARLLGEKGLFLLRPLLADSIRAVRIATARTLVESLGPGVLASVDATERRAFEELETATRYSADLADGAFNWANLCATLGRPAEAETGYRTSIDSDPDFPPARVNYALFLHAQGRVEDAERQLRSVTERAPDFSEAWFDLGLLLGEQGRGDEARIALENVKRGAPAFARAQYNLAVLHQRAGNLSKALDCWTEALSATPDDADLLFVAARTAEDAGDLEKARAWTERGLRQRPGDTHGLAIQSRLSKR